MPEDSKQVGRRYRGEGAPLTTPEDVADAAAKQAPYAAKQDAMPIVAYFAHKGIDNPIMQASMLAFTTIRVATAEDFDAIFEKH
jgi:hypothetical protein